MGINLTRILRLPTVSEQELQVGHENFPTGDAVTLCQRKGDAVDVLLERPSRMSVSPGEGREGREHSPC